MPVAVIRVDSSLKIGSGHLMRCLTLANELRRFNWQCHFICMDTSDNGRETVIAAGHSLHLLEVDAVSKKYRHDDSVVNVEFEAKDASKVIAVISPLSCDLLIVDHYGLGVVWESALEKFCNSIFVIDDLASRNHICNILLDQTYGRTIASYGERVANGTRIICGSDFALLRPEFTGYRSESLRKREQCQNPKNIFISLGGADPGNLTLAILKNIAISSNEKEVILAVSSNFPGLRRLRKYQETVTWLRIECDVKNMAEHMLWADLAIGSGGVTSWERCCMGLPSVVIQIANNQASVIKALEMKGAAIVIEEPSDIPSAILRLIDTSTYQDMAKKAFSLCDGLGVTRVVKHLIMLKESNVALKPITIDDAVLVFQWQHEEGIRKYFRVKEPPIWEQHLRWLYSRLEGPDHKCWMINLWGMPAGIIRLDRLYGETFEVSILISNEYQSLGLAKKALLDLQSNSENLGELVAEVNINNTVSISLFVSCGFKRKSDDQYYWSANRQKEVGDAKV